MIRVNLDDAIPSIYSAFATMLTAEIGDGLTLEGVEGVIVGDRAEPAPTMPVLWVLPQPAVLGTGRRTIGQAEDWEMPFSIIALVQEDDPANGYAAAAHLAGAARRVILRDRKLGLDFVDDVVPNAFDPARATSIDNVTVYAAAHIITVRFYAWEEA